MSQPTSRIVMLSGATKGIGEAIAARLYKDGYRLSLGARNPNDLAKVLRDDRDRVLTVPYDATGGTAAARSWVEATVKHFGSFDTVINNAGMQIRSGFEQSTEAELNAILTVNAVAPYLLTQAAWPHLKAAGHGKVVNIVSLSGVRVKPTTSTLYAMSKHAAMAMTHSLRALGWKDGIRVTAILPGAVATPMTMDKTDVAHDLMMAPQTIADLVAHVLTMPQNASVSMLPVSPVVEQLY